MNRLTQLAHSERRHVYRTRRAVVRKDYPGWEVSYQDHGHERLLLPWSSWDVAMRQALNWTGLDL